MRPHPQPRTRAEIPPDHDSNRPDSLIGLVGRANPATRISWVSTTMYRRSSITIFVSDRTEYGNSVRYVSIKLSGTYVELFRCHPLVARPSHTLTCWYAAGAPGARRAPRPPPHLHVHTRVQQPSAVDDEKSTGNKPATYRGIEGVDAMKKACRRVVLQMPQSKLSARTNNGTGQSFAARWQREPRLAPTTTEVAYMSPGSRRRGGRTPARAIPGAGDVSRGLGPCRRDAAQVGLCVPCRNGREALAHVWPASGA
jgi:hypothetical protein